MKQWLRVLPFPLLIFAVLTFLDWWADPAAIHWLWNLTQATLLGAIGCTGQLLIHKNLLQMQEVDGCIGCEKPE